MFIKNGPVGSGAVRHREPINCVTTRSCEVQIGDVHVAKFEADSMLVVALIVGLIGVLLMAFGRPPVKEPEPVVDDGDEVDEGSESLLIPLDAPYIDPRFKGTHTRLSAYAVLAVSLADRAGVREDLRRGIVVVDDLVIISMRAASAEEREAPPEVRRGQIVVEVETGHGFAFRYVKGGTPPLVPMTSSAFKAWFRHPDREFSWA